MLLLLLRHRGCLTDITGALFCSLDTFCGRFPVSPPFCFVLFQRPFARFCHKMTIYQPGEYDHSAFTPLLSWLKGAPPGINPSSRQQKKSFGFLIWNCCFAWKNISESATFHSVLADRKATARIVLCFGGGLVCFLFGMVLWKFCTQLASVHFESPVVDRLCFALARQCRKKTEKRPPGQRPVEPCSIQKKKAETSWGSRLSTILTLTMSSAGNAVCDSSSPITKLLSLLFPAIWYILLTANNGHTC